MARGRRRRARAKTSASAVQSLVERMANMQVAPRRRRARRRGNRQNGGGNIPGAESGPTLLVPSPGRRRRRRRGGGGNPAPSIGNGGQLSLTRTELFAQVTMGTDVNAPVLGAVAIAPLTDTSKPGVFPFLRNLCKVYSRLRWDFMRIDWRPAVGTTTNGIITYGVRLMQTKAIEVPKSRIDVSALSPVCDHSVWKTSELPIARDLLQTRTWYALQDTLTDVDFVDVAPGGLWYGLQASSIPAGGLVGEFWVTYTVTMDGSRPGN